jgi:hypothetical protein
MPQNLSWKNAIIEVLTDEGEAMHYVDIAEQIVKRQLREALGATPANSVASIVTISIRDEAAESPFYKAGRALFGLKSHQTPSEPGESTQEAEQADDAEISTETIIRALGMFWLRGNVYWKSNPAILGRQQIGADTVDFADQRGVYVLHDRHDVVYVGRSVDRPLGQRMLEHTQDRLNSRWDRFSWFGLYGVNDDGQLNRDEVTANGDTIVSAFESILIECLEPPQNRRRGDNLNAVEFMQARDPEIDKRQTRDLLQQVLAKLE